ncbi:hypothetical protein [Serratia inhibens]|uniref:hypothetical protein n=1 Tax=Serratia inhibens TaxID=2338073 RepID=UPI00025E245C|nr:hypothetical protein [Serratia inhibens]ANS42649.1 hypothetical protein Q5A_010945 [Serratia inhibens PRI-2C]
MKQENKKLVSGIGTNDLAYNIEKQKEIGLTPELQKDCYKAWNDRLKAQKNGRATVCTEWLTYSNFASWWLDTQIDGWSIDKDWLVAGNKEYSPNNCVWIPNKINTLMNDGRKKNNGLPMGVSIQRQKKKCGVYNYYQTKCNVNNVQKCTTFNAPEEAHRQWQLWKTEEINNVICEFESDSCLDSRIVDRLIERRDSIQSDYDNNLETK